MTEAKNNPDAEHDLFTDKVRVGLERVGNTNALALVIADIPIQPELREFLYDGIEEGSSPTFDYVNVATDDIVRKAKNTDSHLDDLLSSGSRRTFFKDNNAQKMAFMTEMAKAVDIDLYSEEISEQDIVVFNQLRDVLKSNASLPFLIISGHGNAEKTYEIGEHAGPNYDRADKIIDNYTKKKKYSAVILIACKPNQNSEIANHGVPLFFVDGFGGIGNKKRFAKAN